MTNGNSSEDFPYWESDRTQPGGSVASGVSPEQLEALQTYLSRNGATFPQQPSHPPIYQTNLPQRQQPITAHPDYPAISITSGKTRIDITITPL